MVDFKSMSTEELGRLIEEARKELASRRENKLVLYTHHCKNESRYHLSKYKHWAKRITGVDTTKTNGYAFQGDFLNVREEHKLPVGSIVVEVCGDYVTAYELTENGKKEFATAQRKSMSALIEKVAEKF